MGAAVIGLVLVQGKGADASLAVEFKQSLVQRFRKLLRKLTAGLSSIFHYESDIGCDCKAEGRRRSFWSPDLPAQDVESVIQAGRPKLSTDF